MFERAPEASGAERCKTSDESVKCPHCNEEIDVNLFGAGPEPRTASDIQAAQSRAKLDDANASTRPNTRTLDEIRKARS